MESLDIKASVIDKYILCFGTNAWPLCELWGIYYMLYYSLCCHSVGPLDLVYIIYTVYIGDPLCRFFSDIALFGLLQPNGGRMDGRIWSVVL